MNNCWAHRFLFATPVLSTPTLSFKNKYPSYSFLHCYLFFSLSSYNLSVDYLQCPTLKLSLLLRAELVMSNLLSQSWTYRVLRAKYPSIPKNEKCRWCDIYLTTELIQVIDIQEKPQINILHPTRFFRM
ncbi:MAG: hypothetical protein J3R72DRAFT_431925, partial [Linnemannia gamsii]